MACNTSLTSINIGCHNNIGSISQILIAPEEFITGGTYSSGTITAIAMSAGTSFVEYQFNKNSASYTEVAGIDLAVGSTLHTTTTTLTIPRREVAKRNALALISAGQRNLIILIKDGNGLYWMQGYDTTENTGANLTGLDGGVGATKGEGSNYVLTFLSEASVQMPEVDSSIIAALVA